MESENLGSIEIPKLSLLVEVTEIRHVTILYNTNDTVPVAEVIIDPKKNDLMNVERMKNKCLSPVVSALPQCKIHVTQFRVCRLHVNAITSQNQNIQCCERSCLNQNIHLIGSVKSNVYEILTEENQVYYYVLVLKKIEWHMKRNVTITNYSAACFVFIA